MARPQCDTPLVIRWRDFLPFPRGLGVLRTYGWMGGLRSSVSVKSCKNLKFENVVQHPIKRFFEIVGKICKKN
jgi:hypothetical protein